MKHDWGIPVAILTDRDTKFMSIFWKSVFTKLNTKFLTTTAYHPQSDGQSERTNQVVEIALRYFTTEYPDEEWTTVLPFLQTSMNNSTNSSTGCAPNELTVGFRVRDPLNMLSDLPPEDYALLRDIKRSQAHEAIAFANAKAKIRYDSKHKPINMKVGDQAYLRLHHGYTIPGLTNKKLSSQREGPFPILRKIGSLAYELDLPPNMGIHPVISISQLEPAPSEPDPFGRVQREPGPVRAADDTESTIQEAPSYEIERILGERISRGKQQYLVSWMGYNNARNVWYDEDNLGNAREAIQDYKDRKAARPAPKRLNKRTRGLAERDNLADGARSQTTRKSRRRSTGA